ncbi:MAG: hypothetical protein ACR2QM_02335 [Longimicrobiales bacterium]
MRAPFAPPRLSEPRKVAAEAHAVDTSSEMESPDSRILYQLTRSLFVRGIGEYSSQERGNVLDPETGQQVYRCTDEGCSARVGSDSHDFRLEGLLAYEPSPGTVFFLGYTREFEDTSAFAFRQVRPMQDGLFLKLSYRFRL